MARFREPETTGRAWTVWRSYNVASMIYSCQQSLETLGQEPEPIDADALGLFDGLTGDERHLIERAVFDELAEVGRGDAILETIYGSDPFSRDRSEAFLDDCEGRT